MLAFAVGCAHHDHIKEGNHVPPPPMLGTSVDAINMTQEINAEASKYVVYAHEFVLNNPTDTHGTTGWRLNPYGQDHVKQIAINLRRGDQFPVVVERSSTTADPNSQYQYPIHFNARLDAARREVVVNSLIALGIHDADQRVVVAPAFAEGLTATEAAAAYTRSLRPGRQRGGFGGGFLGGFGGVGRGGF